MPSGKLCRAIVKAIKIPDLYILLFFEVILLFTWLLIFCSGRSLSVKMANRVPKTKKTKT